MRAKTLDVGAKAQDPEAKAQDLEAKPHDSVAKAQEPGAQGQEAGNVYFPIVVVHFSSPELPAPGPGNPNKTHKSRIPTKRLPGHM